MSRESSLKTDFVGLMHRKCISLPLRVLERVMLQEWRPSARIELPTEDATPGSKVAVLASRGRRTTRSRSSRPELPQFRKDGAPGLAARRMRAARRVAHTGAHGEIAGLVLKRSVQNEKLFSARMAVLGEISDVAA